MKHTGLNAQQLANLDRDASEQYETAPRDRYPPITVRNFTPEEMERIDAAAAKIDRPRAWWIRDRLNKAAKAETKGA